MERFRRILEPAEKAPGIHPLAPEQEVRQGCRNRHVVTELNKSVHRPMTNAGRVEISSAPISIKQDNMRAGRKLLLKLLKDRCFAAACPTMQANALHSGCQQVCQLLCSASRYDSRGGREIAGAREEAFGACAAAIVNKIFSRRISLCAASGNICLRRYASN